MNQRDIDLYLLDVNILIAILWPRDQSHLRVRKWFLEEGARAFSTCALTQSGFIRVILNPELTGDRVQIGEAKELLEYLTQLQGHNFWPMDSGFCESVTLFEQKLVGYRQVTDAYLLGLAIQRDAVLVTLDKAILHLAGREFQKHILLL